MSLVAGASEIFDKMGAYLKRNYPDLESFTMPYCSLAEDEKGKHYRVQISLKRKGQSWSQTAVARANVDSGDIEMFKEGFTWTYWV